MGFIELDGNHPHLEMLDDHIFYMHKQARLNPIVYNLAEAGMVDEIKVDQVLDCSGMLCPLPVIKVSKAMKVMQSDQILKLIATDPGAPPDMEAWGRQTGNELLRSIIEEGKFVFFFRRK